MKKCSPLLFTVQFTGEEKWKLFIGVKLKVLGHFMGKSPATQSYFFSPYSFRDGCLTFSSGGGGGGDYLVTL